MDMAENKNWFMWRGLARISGVALTGVVPHAGIGCTDLCLPGAGAGHRPAELVQAHGGRIGVESGVGRGTTFTIELPVGGNYN